MTTSENKRKEDRRGEDRRNQERREPDRGSDFLNDLVIQVADDNEEQRETLVIILKGLGIDRIIEAQDGFDAWRQLKRGKVDLVISDWDMPKRNGLELFKKMQTSKTVKNVPYLLLTGFGDKERVVEAINAGITDYMVKPVTQALLKKKISQHLK